MKMRPSIGIGSRIASKQRGRAATVALGLTGVGVIVLMVVLAWQAPYRIPLRNYYTIQAAFNSGDNLTDHSQVRIDGKLVGQVLNPHVEHGLAVVDLQMDPKFGPLRSDSRLEVRPRSAIGVRYVDIKPGTQGRPLRDGERMPASQTSATTPLDEVLATFDPTTRERTQSLLQALGGGFLGRGGDLNGALGDAPQMLRNTRAALSAVNARPGATRGLIRGTASAADAADPVRRPLAEGFKPEAAALRPFSEHAGSLRATLEQAPSALATLRDRLPAVDSLAGQLRAFAANLRPALASAPASLDQTAALLRDSRPGLRDADTTLHLAGRAVTPVLQLLDTVMPTLPHLESGLRDALPLVTVLGDHGCDFINWGVRWSSMMAFGNSAGGVLRFDVVSPGPESAFGAGEALKGSPAYSVPSNPYPAPCTAGNEKLGG